MISTLPFMCVHLYSGSGFPVALHVNDATSPSNTFMTLSNGSITGRE